MFNFKISNKKKYKAPQFESARGLNKFSGGTFVTEDTAMQVSAFYSGVTYVSTQIAKLPWHVKDKDNHYPQGSINHMVQERIDQLNKLRRSFDDGNVKKRSFSRKNEIKP